MGALVNSWRPWVSAQDCSAKMLCCFLSANFRFCFCCIRLRRGCIAQGQLGCAPWCAFKLGSATRAAWSLYWLPMGGLVQVLPLHGSLVQVLAPRGRPAPSWGGLVRVMAPRGSLVQVLAPRGRPGPGVGSPCEAWSRYWLPVGRIWLPVLAPRGKPGPGIGTPLEPDPGIGSSWEVWSRYWLPVGDLVEVLAPGPGIGSTWDARSRYWLPVGALVWVFAPRGTAGADIGSPWEGLLRALTLRGRACPSVGSLWEAWSPWEAWSRYWLPVGSFVQVLAPHGEAWSRYWLSMGGLVRLLSHESLVQVLALHGLVWVLARHGWWLACVAQTLL